MGGNSRQKKSSSSSFSVFGLFKSKGSQKAKHTIEEPQDVRKVWPSYEDRQPWKAEPGIDKKASAFIAKFHEERIAAAY